jgi:hypothetical protein
VPDYDSPGATPDTLNKDQVLALAEDLRGAFAARNSEYKRLRALYDGEHWGTEVGNPSPDNAYTLVANYVRPTVDRAVTDLLARMPGIQVMPRGVDENARRLAEGCEGVLYKMWEENLAPRVLRQILFNAVLYRRGVLTYWWDPEKKIVRFRSVSPSNFYPVYDGEDIVECILVSRRLTRELKRRYPKLAADIDSDNDRTDDPETYGTARVLEGTMDATGDGGSASKQDRVNGYTTVTDWYDRHGNWVRVMGNAVHAQKLGYGTGRVPFHEVAPLVGGDEAEPHGEIDDIAELNQYYDQLLSQQANIIRKYSDPTILDMGSGQSPAAIKRIVSGDGGVLPIRKDGVVRFLNWEGSIPDIPSQLTRIEDIIRDLSGRPRSSYGEMATNQSGVMTNMSMTPTTNSTENRATMLGSALEAFHRDALQLYEKFAAGESMSYEGYRPKGKLGHSLEYFQAPEIKGAEIKGWYRNQMKWPSFVRTDDPVWIQGILSQVTSQPPLLPVYDAVELLGHEDAEALLDRIGEQLEDPRFHPDRMEGAINAASALQGLELPGDLGGLDPTAPAEPGLMNEAAEASGSPYRSAL